jgi:predicted Zn-dependent protease with MMP-like domain
MRKHRFERLVARAVAGLPSRFRDSIENVVLLVEAEPSEDTLRELGMASTDTLYGLYFGVPLTQRGSGYGMTLPDRIVLYQRPIEAACSSDASIARLIRQTVVHEIAHHFGMSEEELRGLSQA